MLSRLVNSVSNAFELNVATLSGCADIIVVRQQDGTLRSTPFHVRFGKTKVLRSREKEVMIFVNNVEVDFRMKLSAAGEAFFEIQNADIKKNLVEDLIPEDLSFPLPENVSTEKVQNLWEDKALSLVVDQDTFSTCTPQESQPFRLPPYEEMSRVEFSLSGHLLSDTNDVVDIQADLDCFYRHLVSWDTLNRNPALWYHTSLVCLFDGQIPFYPVRVALPLLASWVAFNRPLTSNAVRILMGTKLQTQSPLQDKTLIDWMFGQTKQSHVGRSRESAGESYTKEETKKGDFISVPPCSYVDERAQDVNVSSRGDIHRSFRPSSEFLEKLNLNYGKNRITFTVTSALQGEKQVSGWIYLWTSNCKIIVSDVDGTITRSDVLGQLMPIVGRDWSHFGVAKLFAKCRENSYEFLYLTARAIGQADATREYLFSTDRADSLRCIQGPLIMSPDRLFSSLKREVIDRQPYVFKIAALREVRRLFPVDFNPFYAGFGNRDSDFRAYVHIGIPESRVFTVDSQGVLHHINSTLKRTYLSLSEISDYVFPPLTKEDIPVDDQFNDFQYWNKWDVFENDQDAEIVDELDYPMVYQRHKI